MFTLIHDELQVFERRLRDELRSPVDFIEAIAEDLVGAGGKRFRPSLSFVAGRLLGADPEATMRVALAVELLHSASLLHDDLIDDAQTRRGSEAAFRRYGNIVSVMSGDYLLARVLRLLAQQGDAQLTMLISETAACVCEAEVLQFQMASLEGYSFDNYFKIIEGKTAVLLATALEGVALLTDAPSGERRALHDFGLAYGRAFQMQDDYLDLLGDPEMLGKPVGGDLREGKATYPVLLLLEAGIAEAREILRRHAGQPGDVARMVELLRQHGADEKTRLRIRQEAERAMAALEFFPPCEATMVLKELAQRELERAS